MEIKKLCKRIKTLWIIRNVIALLIVTAANLIGLLLSVDDGDFTLIAGIVIAFWLIIAVLLLIWPFLSYKNYKYGYDDKHFFISYGVIFKHQITAPICQIQDLHIYQGPIMQIFKMSKIIFATGGSNFELIGIDKTEAQTVIDEVEAMLRARIEVNANEEV